MHSYRTGYSNVHGHGPLPKRRRGTAFGTNRSFYLQKALSCFPRRRQHCFHSKSTESRLLSLNARTLVTPGGYRS